MKRPAFTLIEMLVTVAIVAVLASILLPSIASARRHARAAVCQSNLRQLATALHVYASESDRYVPVRLKSHRGATYVNAIGRSKPRWQWFLHDGLELPIDPRGFELPFGDGDTSDTGRSGREMTSPYFLDPGFSGADAADIRNGAYGYNHQALGNSRTFDDGSTINWPVRPGLIAQPMQTVAFGDSRGGDAAHGQHSYTLDPPRKMADGRGGWMAFGPSAEDGPLQHSPVEMRHDGAGNVAFLDSHVERLAARDLGYHVGDDGVILGVDPAAPPPGAQASNRLWDGTGRDGHAAGSAGP